MMQPVSFTLRIESTSCHSWQGTFRTPESERRFKSELELLSLIQEELQKHGEAETLPQWDKEEKA